MREKEPWPGAPADAWVRAADALPVQRLRAPAVLTDYEAFSVRVGPRLNPVRTGVRSLGWGILVSLFAVTSEGLRSRADEQGFLMAYFLGNPWSLDLAAWVGALLIAVGVIGLIRSPCTRERAMRCHFEDAKRDGVLGKVFDSGHRIFTSEGEWELHFVVDTEISGERAARLIRAIDLWTGHLGAERDPAFDYRMDQQAIVASEDVFGPEAKGAYIFAEGCALEHRAYPWRLVMPYRERPGVGQRTMYLVR